MANYYSGQTNLKIELETNVELTDATLLIKYRRPDGGVNAFEATIDGEDSSKMYYNLSTATDLCPSGNWTFWSHAVFSDGSVGIGTPIVQQIKEEGQVK